MRKSRIGSSFTALRGVAGGLAVLAGAGCGTRKVPSPAAPPAVPATLQPSAATAGETPTERSIRFFAARVQRDPNDYLSCNRLAAFHLQRVRETGDMGSLEQATRAAKASLAACPAEANPTGLALLAETKFTAHDFAAARDDARRLTELAPRDQAAWATLGDTLLELGDYEEARRAFQTLAALGDGTSFAAETRLARLAELYGKTEEAARHLRDALDLAEEMSSPPREAIAWCRWQLGELEFAGGRYAAAEAHNRAALKGFPGYYRALAGLGRALAARGDLAGAIAQYERASRSLPDPALLAALGDLYALAGRKEDAAAQYALVEQIGRLSAANGALYNRQLALFYADHDLKKEEAYAQAAREYTVRRDVYGADAVAWTALKAGRTAEARAAVHDALRLGTRDARLLYHAGMVMRAAGDPAGARSYLERALALSPRFDPLQAREARRALSELKNP